jgi:outer membrane protein
VTGQGSRHLRRRTRRGWSEAGLAILLLGFSGAGGSPAAAQSAEVALTLDEAVTRALERNLDIQVERLNPQAIDFTLASLRSIYYPIVSSTIGQRSQVNPPTSQLNGGQRVANDTLTYNAGVTQALPWGGGDFQVFWNNSRTDTTNIFANFNPSYVTNLNAQFTQPLLRGFGIDLTRQQLLVTRINRAISDVQLRGTITATLASVRNAYWELVFATASVGVARQSLALAEKLVEDNQARVEAGAMAPIDVVQAEAEAASRRQALAEIEATALTSELALKQLIVEGTQDSLWPARIIPSDRPAFLEEGVDVAAAVTAALDRRTDLVQARRQLEATDVTLRFLRNETLPTLDAVANYGLQGLGGTQFIRQGSGLGSVVIGTVPGGFGDALDAITRRSYPTWNVALNLSYPVFGGAAHAQYARARVQRNQALAQIKALELRVATEVTNAGLQVQANLKRVEAATAARSLAQRQLEAEQSKFEVGLSTNFFVVQAQRDLQDAQNSALRALLDYQKSLVEFERAQETSLQGAGITIAGAPRATN